MIDIHIKTIPNDEHRYPTTGDYYTENGQDQIRVSELPDWRYEVLIAIHELIESVLCKHDGITDEAITAFDVEFEHERAAGLHGDEEPGDDFRAPYRAQHQFATNIEQLMAFKLGVNWKEYEKAVLAL